MKNKSYAAATKTVLKINKGGFIFSVLHKTDTKTDPFRVYYQHYERGTLHKKQIAKYADFTSCLYHLYRYWYSIEH